MQTEHYIGLMSGTSTDGVDGVLADLGGAKPRILACVSHPLSADLRAELLALNQPGANELARAARAGNALADDYAHVTHELLSQSGLSARDICALGAHGQTVRHAPDAGYTIQVNAPARLAELTAVPVVADFRSRDIAAGGQGAPLVPAFHAALFGLHSQKAVLNLGGIANLTVLEDPVRGFDTGPANMLMDAWIQDRMGRSYDVDGTWAAGGQCDPGLLELLRAEPWFAQPPPKSTGRDLFSLDWLHTALSARDAGHPPLNAADVQATLLQLTATTIADAVRRHAASAREILVCGGGARNPVLMAALADCLPCSVTTTADYGVPVQAMEATAFAWLAQAHVRGEPACLPAVTGARHATVAGCLYPA